MNLLLNSKIIPKQQLAEELHKQIIIKLEKQKSFSSFKDTVWGAVLVDIQLIHECNKGFWFLLCVINIDVEYE